MTNPPAPPDADALALENEELRHRLREAEELIAAVRTGAVDALAIQGPEGARIFTLESADQGYRALIEQMNEGALLLSPEGTVLYCNAALAGLLDHAPAALLGQAFGACVPADFQDYWAGLVAQGWSDKARGELPLRGPEGSLRPCAVSMNGLKFDGARALAVLVTDVSAAQEIDGIRALVAEQNTLIDRAHDELLRQEAARRAVEQVAAEVGRVLEGIPQIAWTSTPTGINSYLNRRWFDFAGDGPPAEPGPIIGRVHPADFSAATTRWRHSLATGEPLDVECRIRNAAGHYRWMLGRALPSRDEDGNIREWIGTFTDIHEQKLAVERVAQAQDQLRANNEQLTRANEDLDNFVYTASHGLARPQGAHHQHRGPAPGLGGGAASCQPRRRPGAGYPRHDAGLGGPLPAHHRALDDRD